MAKRKGINVENQIEPVNSMTVVTQQNVKDLKTQRELLKRFVKGQLVEANFKDKNSRHFGEGDYGIIPGTQKRCLLKPGAEKLLRLFNFGVRFRQVDKEIDRVANVALYTYRAEVYSLKSGIVIAESDATANSQEIKYRERTEWRTNDRGVRESTKVETPIYDVLNTLQKMAQKRALVSAVLLATGASEYFTQDMLEEETLAEVARDVSPAQTSGSSTSNESQKTEGPPICCDKPMMEGKYKDKELGDVWYCLNCRSKKARAS